MQSESSVLPVSFVVLFVLWAGYHLLFANNRRSISFHSWHIHSNPIGIAISTTAFNQLPTALVQLAHPKTRSRASVFYDLGIVWSVFGLFLSLGLLVGQAWTVGASLWAFVSATGNTTNVTSAAIAGISPLVKRVTSVEITPDSGFIKPLIPGVTIPFSQAIYLVLSFLLAQLIHEPGHAITAALSSISPLLMTVQLSPIFPSASVTLPSVELARTSPRERARIATAGCWHNILSVLFLGIVNLLALQTLTPVSHIGRAVLGFQPDTALAQAIPVGSIITHLNDRPLGATSSKESNDLWSDLFINHDPDIPSLTSGWCVSESWFLAQNSTCCNPYNDFSSEPTICFNPSTSISAFTSASASTPLLGRCLLPSIMLAPHPADHTDKTLTRCPCLTPQEICVKPDESKGEIIRITFLGPRTGRSSPDQSNERWKNVEESIVWQGPRELIHSQIETSPTVPPVWIFKSFHSQLQSIALLSRYIIVISTTLSIFNLLPLSLLDGGFFLDALLDYGLPDESGDITRSHGERDIDGSGDSADELGERGSDGDGEADAEDGYELLSRRVERVDSDSSARAIGGRATTNHIGRKRRRLKKKIKSSLSGLTIALGIWVLGGMAVRLALDLQA